MEKLVDLCRSMDAWLRADKQNVLVVHCHVRMCVCCHVNSACSDMDGHHIRIVYMCTMVIAILLYGIFDLYHMCTHFVHVISWYLVRTFM